MQAVHFSTLEMAEKFAPAELVILQYFFLFVYKQKFLVELTTKSDLEVTNLKKT